MSIFSVLTSKIFGGLSLALLLVVAALWFQNGRLEGKLETARAKLDREIAAHAETLKSVKTLSDALDQKNAESMARAKARDDAIAEAAQAKIDADRRYRSTQAKIDALRSAVGKNSGDCSVPSEVTDALSGL